MLCRLLRPGARLQGPQVGALVFHRPHGPRRGGTGIFGEERSGDLRRLPVRRSRGGHPPVRGRAGLFGRVASADPGAHLDDHSLDDPVESRDRRPSRPGLRPRDVALPAFRRRARSPGARREGGRLGVAFGRRLREGSKSSGSGTTILSLDAGASATTRRSSHRPADYVTVGLDGLVHTAPGHGEDDFRTGERRASPCSPLDDAGRFTEQCPGTEERRYWTLRADRRRPRARELVEAKPFRHGIALLAASP
jgi:hypothetical protein